MNRSTLRSLTRYAKRPLTSAICMCALFISLNMTLTAPASAAIYKCISGSGAVTYSGRKCPEQDTTAQIIADSGIGSARRGSPPTTAAANPTPDPEQWQRQPRQSELEPLVNKKLPLTGS